MVFMFTKKLIKKLNNTNYTTNELNIFIQNINKNKKEILNYAFCGYGIVKQQYLCVNFDFNYIKNKNNEFTNKFKGNMVKRRYLH